MRTTILIYLYRLLKSLDFSANLKFFNDICCFKLLSSEFQIFANLKFFNDLCCFKLLSSEFQIFAPLNLNDLCPAAEVYKGI